MRHSLFCSCNQYRRCRCTTSRVRCRLHCGCAQCQWLTMTSRRASAPPPRPPSSRPASAGSPARRLPSWSAPPPARTPPPARLQLPPPPPPASRYKVEKPRRILNVSRVCGGSDQDLVSSVLNYRTTHGDAPCCYGTVIFPCSTLSVS